MLDIKIIGAHVLDGTGAPWFRADIEVKNGRIQKTGKLGDEAARAVISAEGYVVSPGFIDMHSHSDDALLINGRAESKIRQGVTTEVIGNCGDSGAPINYAIKREMEKTAASLVSARVKIDYSTLKDYAGKLERQGISVNVAPLVGHGNLRRMAVGYDDRLPTRAELEKMKRVLAGAMKQGAFGMSTGLIYPPGSYAHTPELIELAKVAASFGGIYTSHIRGEGNTLFKAVQEAITIGKKAKIPVEISHHKAGGKKNWGKVKGARKLMEDARKRGVEVTCDVYPYVASSFGLVNMLPDWAHEGGPEKILQRLHSKRFRASIRREMERGSLASAHWGRTMIAQCPKHTAYQGRFISELAKKSKKDPFDFTFDLLIEENLAASVVRFGLAEEDVEYVLGYENSMIGSDGSALAPYGVLGRGHPHPRNYGTFPRVLGHYVRERSIISLPEAVRKMTSLPAQKLGLRDRGVIRPGSWADLVVFNHETIIDVASYSDPKKYPRGIEHVIVNGVLTVSKGRHTGAKAGKVLRRL
jgi:N-acyl-D-amino-acid deacylase